MRIALISDIHGNRVALEAALADIAASGVELTLCLGDVVATGPEPRGVLERLRREKIPVVMGNTDAWMLAPEPAEAPATDDDRRLLEVEQWGASLLDNADREALRAFAPTLAVDLGHGRLLAYHGSPRSYHDPIRPETPDDQLAAWFDGQPAAVYAGGHTHTPMLRPFREALVINPGSVGLPVRVLSDGTVVNPAVAEYAILEWSHGRRTLEFRRVLYELAELVKAVGQSGLPNSEWYLKGWSADLVTPQ